MKYLLIAVTTYFLNFAAMASDAVEYRTNLTFSPESSALNAVTEMQIPKKYRSSGTVALFLNKDFSLESSEMEQLNPFMDTSIRVSDQVEWELRAIFVSITAHCILYHWDQC